MGHSIRGHMLFGTQGIHVLKNKMILKDKMYNHICSSCE